MLNILSQMGANLRGSASVSVFIVAALWATQPAHAGDDTVTYGTSLMVPVFEQIDARGVNLTQGSFHVSTPIMELRQGQYHEERGLRWMGQSWTALLHNGVTIP